MKKLLMILSLALILCFMVGCQNKEALAKTERAVQLDPLNSIILTVFSVPFFYLHRWDDAIERCQNAFRTSPNDPLAHNGLWELYYMKGMYEESLKSAKAFFTGLGNTEIAEVMAQGYEEDGYSGAMISAAETWKRLQSRHIFPPIPFLRCML